MTDAELWDYLQERFGLGDWDEATSAIPWWQFRGREIAKLKSMMRKRRAQHIHLVTAADFAIEHKRPIYALYQLFALIPEAMAWRRQQHLAEQKARLSEQVEEAMHEAWEAGEPEWAGRLLRASPADAQTVINEWRNR